MSTSIHRTERTLLEEFLAPPRTMTMFQSSLPHIHTAVLVKRGKVIAHATNRAGSRSMGSGYSDYTIHAERNVVKSLGDISQLRGADMYVMRISRDHKKQGFEIVGISINDEMQQLPPFAREFKINYPLLVGLDRDDVMQAYGPIGAIPVTMIVGRDGKMCYRRLGLADLDQVEREIKSLL